MIEPTIRRLREKVAHGPVDLAAELAVLSADFGVPPAVQEIILLYTIPCSSQSDQVEQMIKLFGYTTALNTLMSIEPIMPWAVPDA